MKCPTCPAELSLREYAWTHTHPSRVGRLCGGAMMLVGGFTAGAGLLEVLRLVK